MRVLSCTRNDRIECDETSCIDKHDAPSFAGFPMHVMVWEQHGRSKVSFVVVWCCSDKFAVHKRGSSF